MSQKELCLEIPEEKRHIKARLNYAGEPFSSLQQLIIIATGLHSHMDKPTQTELSKNYQQAGFATLQFNFMAHGIPPNQSEGEIDNVTLTSGVQDLKTVWNYAQTHLPKSIDKEHIALNANSYGALTALMAVERQIISPESMVLIAPFDLERFKRKILPLKIMSVLMPHQISKILGLPISSKMVTDFLKYHTHDLEKKRLLRSTAVHFFVGSEDQISSAKTIQKWCNQFNAESDTQKAFIDINQADYTIYSGVQHFEIPETIQHDIRLRSTAFIKKIREIHSR